mgnify:CR=1 FL=1
MIFQQFLHSTLHTTCRAETMLLHKARRGNLTSHSLLSNSIQKFLLRKSETGKYLAKLMVIIQYQSMDDALYHLTISLSLWRCLVLCKLHNANCIIHIDFSYYRGKVSFKSYNFPSKHITIFHTPTSFESGDKNKGNWETEIPYFLLSMKNKTYSCTTIKLQLYNYTCYGCTTPELWSYNDRG